MVNRASLFTMTRTPGLALLAALVISGCESTVRTGQLDEQSLGPLVALGESQTVSLPPSQFGRVHFPVKAGQKLQVSVLSKEGTSPVSLQIYPVISVGKPDQYGQPPSSYPLKPVQKSGTLPLTLELVTPDQTAASSALVVELKNIGPGLIEAVIEPKLLQ